MKSKPRRIVVASILFLFFSTLHLAHAAVVPISVFPNPVQFGVVPENSTSFPVSVYISNTTSSSAVVTTMSISGTSSNKFAFSGLPCVGTISGGQTCQMAMTFTPSSIGNFTANLVISVQGLTQPISIPLEGSGGNPIPTITSLSPPSAYVNGPGFTLAVNGTGFVSGAVVYWNNVALPTTYVSATQVKAQVPASDLIGTSSVFVNVSNPPPGGGFSVSVNFNVVALDPSLSFASPNSVVAGATATSILLNGNNFQNGAHVLWNGTTLPTTYISSQQLQITPTATQLASAGIVELSVSNPAPGGLSTAIYFDVTYPVKVTILDLPANDLVWDPFAQRIYASLPSSFGPNGNTIAVVNPFTATLTALHFAGSEPNQLALSGDSKYLYVGLNGSGSVQRLMLPTFTPDIEVSLGSGTFSGFNIAQGLQVSPGNSHTFAVAEAPTGCCGGSSGLFFFTDATQLANSITSTQITDIVFANSTTLFGYNGGGTVSEISVSSSGGTLGKQWNGLVEGSTIQYAAGLIYGSAGQVLNPTTSVLMGTYDVSGGTCCSPDQLLPDPAINRVFVVGQSPFFPAPFGPGTFAITSYNLAEFTPLAVANLSQLSGSVTPAFIRWGSNGLAFVVQSGCCGNFSNQLVLVQSSSLLLTAAQANNPVPVAQSLFPSGATHGGWNFPLTIQGTGFVPGSQVTWNGHTLAADYISPTKLRAYVPASAIVSTGTANIVVFNRRPTGTLASVVLTFTIK